MKRKLFTGASTTGKVVTEPLVVTSFEAATRRKGNLYLVAVLALFASIFAFGAWTWIGFSKENGGPVGLFTQTDFPAIVIGAGLVNSGHGANLYNLDLQLREQQRIRAAGYLSLSPDENKQLKYPYPYTPFLAVLWSPLSALSPLTGMAVWDLINIIGMAGGLWFLLSSLPIAKTTRLTLLLAGITCLPFIVNLEQGQSSGIVMLGLGVGIGLLRRGQDLSAGLALGLLALKVQWLPFILLVLLFKGRWRALLGVLSTGVALSLVVLLTMGTGWIPGYLNIVQSVQQYGRELLLDPWYSHSLSGGLTALLGRGAEDVVRVVNTFAMLVFAGLLLFVWRGMWRPGTARWDGLMSLTVLGTLFTDTQLNTHDLCLLVLPAGLITSGLRLSETGRKVEMRWGLLLWVAYLITALPTGLVLNPQIRITTLLMALMLAYSAPLVRRHFPSRV